jgi:exopolysaccharide production protein ExoQ
MSFSLLALLSTWLSPCSEAVNSGAMWPHVAIWGSEQEMDFGAFLSVLTVVALFGAAAASGLGLWLLVLGGQRLSQRVSPSARLSAILCLAVLGSSLSVALSGRVLIPDSELALNPTIQLASDPSPWGDRASQLCTALIVLLALIECFGWALRQTRMPHSAVLLWGTMLGYFLCAVGVSGLFGTFRNPRLNDVYAPLALTAVALLSHDADIATWRRLRLALILPSFGSLLAVLIAPKLVLLTGYSQSVIPGFTQRLYGLAGHANGLGIVVAVALTLEFATFVRARPNWAIVGCHLFVLVLTQSKTAWLAALLSLGLVRWHWVKEKLFPDDRWRFAAVLTIAGCIGLSLLSVATLVALGARSVQASLARAGVSTFTGRTSIWQTTLEEFTRSPLTGYGPSLWDLRYRLEHGMLYVGQAHNQFVQILGQAGLLGAISMLAYVATMLALGVKNAKLDGGWAQAVVWILLVRCMSESPLRMEGVMGWDAWLHLVVVAAVASAAGKWRVAKVTSPVHHGSRNGAA